MGQSTKFNHRFGYTETLAPPCFCSPRLSELTYNVVYPPYSIFSLTACSSCQVLLCDPCCVSNNTALPISKTDLAAHRAVLTARLGGVQKTTNSSKAPLGLATREPVRCNYDDAAWMTERELARAAGALEVDRRDPWAVLTSWLGIGAEGPGIP